MRTFTFTAVLRVTADGRTRMVEGRKWFALTKKLYKAGRVAVVQGERTFAGYGSSTDVGYSQRTYTVNEKPGAFA